MRPSSLTMHWRNDSDKSYPQYEDYPLGRSIRLYDVEHICLRFTFQRARVAGKQYVTIDWKAAKAAQKIVDDGSGMTDYSWYLKLSFCPLAPILSSQPLRNGNGAVFYSPSGGGSVLPYYVWSMNLEWEPEWEPHVTPPNPSRTDRKSIELFRVAAINGQDGDPEPSIRPAEGKPHLEFLKVSSSPPA